MTHTLHTHFIAAYVCRLNTVFIIINSENRVIPVKGIAVIELFFFVFFWLRFESVKVVQPVDVFMRVSDLYTGN